jgi:hypothetical protein
MTRVKSTKYRVMSTTKITATVNCDMVVETTDILTQIAPRQIFDSEISMRDILI